VAKLEVEIPDELVAEARAKGVDVTSVTRRALQQAVSAQRIGTWLASRSRPSSRVSHDTALAALDAVREELDAGLG
jgi:post-segregation antitoxin (ccd killing protein)